MDQRILTYCSECESVTDSINTKSDGNTLLSKCKKCGSNKINNNIGYGLVNTILNSKYLPELHLIDQGDDGKIHKVNFVGPFTKLDKRLKDYNEQEGTYSEVITKPINRLDRAAFDHDIAYGKYHDLENRNIADKKLFDEAISVFDDNTSTSIQKLNALIVASIMESKYKLGYGIGGSYNYSTLKLNSGEMIKSLIGLLIIGTPLVGNLLYEKFKN